MKRDPMIYHADAYGQNYDSHPQVCLGDGKWYAARPLFPRGVIGLRHRIKTAWHVFTGRYDALRWQETES